MHWNTGIGAHMHMHFSCQSEEAASLSSAREQLGVWCLAQGHLDRAQEVNWHLSSYQSTLSFSVWSDWDLNWRSIRLRSHVPTDWATAESLALKRRSVKSYTRSNSSTMYDNSKESSEHSVDAFTLNYNLWPGRS